MSISDKMGSFGRDVLKNTFFSPKNSNCLRIYAYLQL
jgi:hypothetical protein